MIEFTKEQLDKMANTCMVFGCETGVKDENGDNPTYICLAEDITKEVLPLVKKINDLVGPKYAIWATSCAKIVDENGKVLLSEDI